MTVKIMEEDEQHRKRREEYNSKCEDGDGITGYITHLVEVMIWEHISVIGLSLNHQSIPKAMKEELIVEDL